MYSSISMLFAESERRYAAQHNRSPGAKNWTIIRTLCASSNKSEFVSYSNIGSEIIKDSSLSTDIWSRSLSENSRYHDEFPQIESLKKISQAVSFECSS